MNVKVSSIVKTGIVIFVALIILILGINYLKGIDFFNPDNSYYVIYDKVDGLEKSADILINGFKVGQVRNIHFQKNKISKLVVHCAIDKDYKIPLNTIARIYSSDLMGTKSIELILSKSDKYYNAGDTINGAIEESLKDQVSLQMLPLKKKAEDLMQEIEEAIAVVKYVFNEKTRDNLTKSFESIKYTIKNLEASSYSIDTLVQNEKIKLANIFTNIELITLNLSENNEALTNIFQNLSSISDSIAKSNVKSALISAASALEQLDSIVNKINNGSGSLGLLVNNDTLYYNLEGAAYNLDRLVEDLRINPKRYVHLSVFDVGKTVYTGDKNIKINRNEKQQYKVQILTANKPIALNPENFRGLKNVEEFITSGTYQYMVGSKKTIEKARKMLDEIHKLYPDAFIVIFKNGEKIPLK